MNRTIVVVCALLVALPVSGHLFNHTGRIADCATDLAPTHSVNDGHAHAHHTDAVGPHAHDGIAYGPNHTHGYHFHDPCNQTGMQRPAFADMGPLTKTHFEDAIIRTDDPLQSTIITDSEAFLSDVKTFVEGSNLVIVGDQALAKHAAKGTIKGNGTANDPYIIEGLLIRNVLMIKDTSKCVVIRDNVIHSRAIIGPLADPSQIIDLRTEMDALQKQEDATEKAVKQAKANATQNTVIASLEKQLESVTAQLDTTAEKAKQGRYALGDDVADDVSQLAWNLYDEARGALTGAGRLILDWNGQCIHTYNNIVEDLRVNRNNMRTGYATGGVIEDNRFYGIGQIRHYDGEFRENEVGWREHLWGLLPDIPESQPAMRSLRAMNVDGFNQGWFHDNLIFGSVDLDYHGHHHGTGFFAPVSHYHGADFRTAYMIDKNTGQCMYPVNGTTGPLSPLDPYSPTDLPLTGMPDGCLPHMDHAKRWTSGVFEDNTVIDPYGYAVRYEDRNHQGDDRYANSESMEELNAPHIHRSHIEINDNVVLGSIWVDVFNSPGIEVWSDDYAEVKRDTKGAIIGAVEHLGAHPIPSHIDRSDGWLDITGNLVYTLDKPHRTAGFHYAWDGIQINHAFDLELLNLSRNELHLLPHHFTANHTDDDVFIADLQAGKNRSVSANNATVHGWGTHRDGPQSYGIVLHYLQASNATVCDNHIRGFDVGFYAWNMIYTDSNVTLCNNTYGGATHPSLLRYTPPPTSPPYGLTSPLRDQTNQTSFEPLLDPVYDRADAEEAKARAKAKQVEDIVRNRTDPIVPLPDVPL